MKSDIQRIMELEVRAKALEDEVKTITKLVEQITDAFHSLLDKMGVPK